MSSKVIYFKTETLNVTPLQFLIMIQLMEGPKYGYEILKNLKEDFSESWSPQTGTIYPALRGMIRKGLIEKIKTKEKYVYHLSEQSEKHLKKAEAYIKEYLRIANQFIESILKRIPKSHAQIIFNNIIKTGNLEIIPEHIFLKELNRLTEPKQSINILHLRKKTLLKKIAIIEEELSDKKEG